MTTAPKSTRAIAASFDAPRHLPMSWNHEPSLPTSKPAVKALDAKNDEGFTCCDDEERLLRRHRLRYRDVKTDDHGLPMTMGSIKAMQGMLRASEVFEQDFTEPGATFGKVEQESCSGRQCGGVPDEHGGGAPVPRGGRGPGDSSLPPTPAPAWPDRVRRGGGDT